MNAVMFVQGGKDNRFVNLSRADPSIFCLTSLGSSEYIALRSLTSTRHKVVVNLQLGCVLFSNLVAGGQPDKNNSAKKKVVRVILPAYFGLRNQSAISEIAPDPSSLYGQVGEQFMEFSTLMGPKGA